MRRYGPMAVSSESGIEGFGPVADFSVHDKEGKGPVAVSSEHDNEDSAAIKGGMVFDPPSILNKHCLT